MAFALDYHGGGSRWRTATQMMARLGEFREDLPRVRAIGTAGLDVLSGEPRTDTDRLAAIGYCFGGTLVPGAGARRGRPQGGRRVPLRARHRPTRGRPQHHAARCWRSSVPTTPSSTSTSGGRSRRRCGPGGVDWQLVVYGGAVHSFTNPRASNLDLPGIAFDEATDRRSWQAMLDLFAEVLG